jgi:hypothetical protein
MAISVPSCCLGRFWLGVFMPVSLPSAVATLARQRSPAPDGWTNDIIVVALGTAIFLALGFWFHPYVIGVPVFGR